jgi:hypothetical protein
VPGERRESGRTYALPMPTEDRGAAHRQPPPTLPDRAASLKGGAAPLSPEEYVWIR